MGGLVGRIIGHWLEIEYLWVQEPHRHSGLGSRLLAAAETEALERGCHTAILTTYDFQARAFYEKHGYAVVFTQEHFPVANTRYHMIKPLA